MKLDRDKFWQGYHDAFDRYGATTQATVDALNADLDKFETETLIHGIAQFAYALATEYHETGINDNHFVPVKEGRQRAGSPGRANQDRYWNTGFYGRGKVQTTWESGYLAVGNLLDVGDLFVQNPDLLLTDNWAYEAMVAGMSHGIYRKDGRGAFTLDRMLQGDAASMQQYEDARQIINGDESTNGLLIAGYAKHFEQILTDSQLSAATVQPSPPLTPTNPVIPPDEAATSDMQIPADPAQPPINSDVDNGVPVAGPVASGGLLAQAGAVGDKLSAWQMTFGKLNPANYLPTMPTGLGTKILTIWGMIASVGLYVWHFLHNHPEVVIPATVIFVAVIAMWIDSRHRNNSVGSVPPEMINTAVASAVVAPAAAPTIQVMQTNETN